MPSISFVTSRVLTQIPKTRSLTLLKRTYSLSLLLLLMTGLVFSRVPFFDFVLLEDPTHLDSHPQFSSAIKTNTLSLWKKPYLIYMPLTYSVWRMAEKIGTPKKIETIPRTKTGVLKEFRFYPMIFHLLPLLFHLGTVFILFWLLCFLTHHPLGSFFGALFFAIHPIQVESVAWVSGLKQPLAGFMGLSAILIFLIGQELPPKTRLFKGLYGLSTILFLMALFSNPSSLSIPIATAVLLFFLYKKERFLFSGRLLVYWLILAVPVLWWGRSTRLWTHTSNIPLTLKEKIILALDSLSFYFSKILFPMHLGIDYGRTPDWVLTQTSVYTTASIFFIFIFSLTLFLRWNKFHWALAGEGFFIASLLPLFLFNRLLFQTSSSVADHDLYLALVGISIVIAFRLKTALKQQSIQLVVILTLVLLATRTYFQTGIWKNSSTLLTHALKINSESSLAHRNLGLYFEREENYEQAVSHFKSAAELSPQPIDFNKIGNIYLSLNRPGEAKTSFEKALALNPLSATDYHGLGLSWLSLGNKLLAQENFAKANALSPRQISSLNALHQVKRAMVVESQKPEKRKQKARR